MSRTKIFGITYHNILLPDPAVKSCQAVISACDKGEVEEKRTFAVNPQERARRYPLLKPVALSEP